MNYTSVDHQTISENYLEFSNINVTSDMIDKIYYCGVNYSIACYFDYLQAYTENDLIKVFYDNKDYKCFFYFKGDQLHRKDGPAVQVTQLKGNMTTKWIREEIWYQDGVKFNHNGGPTYTLKEYIAYTDETYDIYGDYSYDEKHNIDFYKKQWFNKYGHLHRIGAPAKIQCYLGKKVTYYYINGIQINENEAETYKIYNKVVNKFKRNYIKKVLYNSGFCKDISRLVSQFVF